MGANSGQALAQVRTERLNAVESGGYRHSVIDSRSPLRYWLPQVQLRIPTESNERRDVAVLLRIPSILFFVFGFVCVGMSAFSFFDLLVLEPHRPHSDLFYYGGPFDQLAALMNVGGMIQGALALLASRSIGRLRFWNACVAATVVAMFPCSLGCVFGLPLGIWLLAMLRRPNVRAQFA